MSKGSGGTRTGGTAGGVSNDVSQPRTSLSPGQQGWSQVEANANHVFWAAATDRTDGRGGRYESSMSESEKRANWTKNYNELDRALTHIEKYGTDFEKSVAGTIRKGMRKYDEKAFKIAYVSYKQSRVLGRALAETHYKRNEL